MGIIVIASIVIILYFVLRDKDDNKGDNKDGDNDGDKDEDKGDDKDDKQEDTCLIGEEDKCLSCNKDKCASCNNKYKLVNGTCIAEFSFRAIYEINEVNTNISLMNDEYKDNIISMEIDNETICGCTNYTFPSPGNYNVYVVLNTTNISSLALFNDTENLREIYFSKEFKLNDITSLGMLFQNCINLLSADISNLNFEKIISMDRIFFNCPSLKTIKFPNSNTPNLKSMKFMFVDCNNLASIDITKFNTEKVYNMFGLFFGCNSLSSIDLSNF